MSSGIYYPVVSGDDGRWGVDFFLTADEYHSLGHDGSRDVNIFARFLSVAIDKNSVIESAVIRFVAATTSGNEPNIDIYGNDIDNAVAPTSYAEAYALDKTTAKTDWLITGGWTDGASYDSPTLKDIIQEIVNRPGWANGNALQLLIYNDGSASAVQQFARSIDYSSGTKKPELHIEWEPPPAGGALFFGMNF